MNELNPFGDLLDELDSVLGDLSSAAEPILPEFKPLRAQTKGIFGDISLSHYVENGERILVV